MQSLTLRNDLDINPGSDWPVVYHSGPVTVAFIFDSNFVIPSRSRRSRSRPVINNKRKGDWKQLAAGDRRSWLLVGVSGSVIGFHWLEVSVAGEQH